MAELEGRPERISIPFPVVLTGERLKVKTHFLKPIRTVNFVRGWGQILLRVDTDPIRNHSSGAL